MDKLVYKRENCDWKIDKSIYINEKYIVIMILILKLSN